MKDDIDCQLTPNGVPAPVSMQNEGLDWEKFQSRLNDGVKDVEEKLGNMPKDMLLLIGETQVGKSFLKELLSNGVKNLTVQKEVGAVSITCPSKSTLIGEGGGISCTKTPQLFRVNEIKMTFVDTPGMDDNRGSFAEIIGKHTLSHVASHAKRLKFVLVLPYDVLITNSNKATRMRAYEFAWGFLKSVVKTGHVKAAAISLGLVVNKVGGDDNDYQLRDLILDALKRDAAQASPELSLALRVIGEKENIFWVRQPHFKEISSDLKNPDGSCPLAVFKDEHNDKPVYELVREKLIEFCDEKLEYINKPPGVNFTVSPSEKTKAELYRDVYTPLVDQITNCTKNLLKHLLSGIQSGKGRWNELDREEKVDMAHRLESAQASAPSSVLEYLATTLNQDLCSEELTKLKSTESYLKSLQEITGVETIKIPDTRELMNQFKVNLYETQKEFQEDLISVMLNTVSKLLENVKREYMARCAAWTDQIALYGLAAGKIEEHLANLKEIDGEIEAVPPGLLVDESRTESIGRSLQTSTSVSSQINNSVASLEVVYQLLSLVITEPVRNKLDKLKWAEGKTGHHRSNLKGALSTLIQFLEVELKERNSQDDKQREKMEETMQATIIKNFNVIVQDWLNNPELNAVSSKVTSLKGIIKALAKYCKDWEQRRIKDVSTEIQYFNDQMDTMTTPRLGKFVWSVEPWQYKAFGEKCLETWEEVVDNHFDDLLKLLEWYSYFDELRKYCEGRYEMQRNGSQLKDVEEKLLPQCIRQLAEKRAAKNFGKVSGLNEMYLIRNVFKDVLKKIEKLLENFGTVYTSRAPDSVASSSQYKGMSSNLFECLVDICTIQKTIFQSYLKSPQESKLGDKEQKLLWNMCRTLKKIISFSSTFQQLTPNSASECKEELEEIFLELFFLNRYEVDNLLGDVYQVVDVMKDSNNTLAEISEDMENLCLAMDVFLGLLLEEWEESSKKGSEQLNRQKQFRNYFRSLQLRDILENGLKPPPRLLCDFPKTPSTITEIFTNEKYANERNTFMDIVSSLASTSKQIRAGDSLLVFGPQNVLISDFVGDVMTSEEKLNLFIISRGPVFVDRDLVAENAKIMNLFICASELKCVGRKSITLRGENGKSFPSAAADGDSWGKEGENGKRGEDGGPSGNVYIVTKKQLNCPLLTITTRGGDGGPGQDGGNGHCGYDDESSRKTILQKFESGMKKFDKFFTALCKDLKLDSPALADFQLDKSEKVKTPNANMYENVQVRFFSMLAFKYLINYVTIKNTEEEVENKIEGCLCSALIDMTSSVAICDYKDGSWKTVLDDKLSLGGPCSKAAAQANECVVVAAFKDERMDEEILLSAMSELGVHLSGKYSGHSTSEEMLKFLSCLCDIVERLCDTPSPEKWNLLATNLTRGVLESLKMSKRYEKGEGGSGGNGGDAGSGGKPGRITMTHFESKSVICREIFGNPGVGGNGGAGGQFGQDENQKDLEVKFGQDGQDGGLGKEKSEDSDDGKESLKMDVLGHLRKWVESGEVDETDKLEVISILTDHDWPVEQEFTAHLLATEYLRVAEKFILSSSKCDGMGDRFGVDLKKLKIFENILARKKNKESTQQTDEENALKLLEDCIRLKTKALEDHLKATPTIFNLEKYLSACEKQMESYKESKRCAVAVTHQSALVNNLEKQICEAKRKKEDTISKSLEEIGKLFAELKQNIADEVNTRIEKIGKYEKYEVAKKVAGVGIRGGVMGAAGVAVVRYGAPTPIISASSAASSAAEKLAEKVFPKKPREIPAFNPEDDLNDEKQRKKDCRRMVVKVKEIIEKATKEHPELHDAFSKSLRDLEGAMASQNNERCEQLFTEARSEIFNRLEEKRSEFSKSPEIHNFLDFLYYELVMTDASQLYGKDKRWWEYIRNVVYDPTASEQANTRNKSLETNFYPILERFPTTLKCQMEGNEHSNLKQLVEKLHKYLGHYVTGLKAERDLNQLFEDVNKLVKFYENSQKDIENLERARSKANFIENDLDGDEHWSDLELKEKLGKIKYLTKAQLLVLDYVKIEQAVKQAAFPYAACYLQQNLIERVHFPITGPGAISLNQRAEYCNELISHFKTEYLKRASQRNPEDDFWCLWHFSGKKGTKAESAKYTQDGIRQVDLAFYEWPQQEFGQVIRQLCLGQVVKLTAEIKSSLLKSMAAIKINGSIELQFSVQSNDQTEDEHLEYQKELNKMLDEKFDVKMTHSGTSAYKLTLPGETEAKYYQFSVEPLVLSENKVRQKMTDYVLSPFTDWELELELLPHYEHEKETLYAELADKFAHSVSLKLVGKGDFFKEQGWKDKTKAPSSVDDFYSAVE